jgi:hypothetical protein
MPTVCAVHLGHSHLAALTPTLFDRPLSTAPAVNDIEHYMFDLSKHDVFGTGDERFAYGIKNGNGDFDINPFIPQAILGRIPADREVVCIANLGGNSHNAFFLLQNQRQIDFIIPGLEDLPLVQGAEIIPYEAIKQILMANCQIYLDDLRGIKNGAPGRVFFMISPPPIQNDDYVRSVVDRDPYFAAFGHTMVTPAMVRYKAWVVHSKIYADLCSEIGVEVIEAPEEGIVDGRWLAPDCVGYDPTHANLVYGEYALINLERRLDGRFAGWDWIG